MSASSGQQQPELRYLAIGKVVRAHGLRGELSVAVLTDFPDRFETMEWVYVGNEFEAFPFRVEHYRWHKDNILLTLAGIANRSQAEALRGQLIQIPVDEAVPLPEGEYYLYQLIGLQVVTVDGQKLGTISQILETGANDVYVVDNSHGRQLLLPGTPEVVQAIDIEQGRMVVKVIDGLI
ncbi:MAG: ribosome maturation factor RimM [Chloroflexota bacterium]